MEIVLISFNVLVVNQVGEKEIRVRLRRALKSVIICEGAMLFSLRFAIVYRDSADDTLPQEV